ncbi:ZIP family metal transporter [Haloarchaeobius litoreus]|uniref:ZIP family metal transporter n=1 Tax=Haloarchaeobius litoreus TaxID=755306 RepID=A0ABD6DLK9_9EURY|nr:metal transporter [Haloarchaeobius litoreus]
MSDEPESDGGVVTHEESPTGPFGLPTVVAGVVPIVMLAVLVGVFLVTTPLAGLQSDGEPLPDVSIDYTTVPEEGTLVVHVTNNGAAPVTIDQLQIDDAYWNYEMSSPGDDRTLQPRESGTIRVPYHWSPGFDHHVTVMTAGGATFGETIVATQQTPGFDFDVVLTLAVVGLFVGVIPVALGMLWFPFLESMSDRWLHAVLAFSAGILAFLAVDAGFEAFELGRAVPSAYMGELLVVLGIVGAMLLLQAAMDWQSGGGEPSGLSLAYAAALGIGLHNLAEGLAIGSAFALGRASLGAFLIVGFMIHNVTEGPVVVAPLARSERPALWHFGAIGLLAGAPAILGGWIGNLFFSPLLGALFLAIGVGALLQVVFDIGGMIRKRGELLSTTNSLGFLVGLVVMYATDFFITL